MYTREDVEKYVLENSQDLVEGLANCDEIPSMMKDHFQPIWNAGCWLSRTLRKDGASDEESSSICFAHGQRCFGRDPIDAALALANEYAETGDTKDKPGPILGEEIAREVLDLD